MRALLSDLSLREAEIRRLDETDASQGASVHFGWVAEGEVWSLLSAPGRGVAVRLEALFLDEREALAQSIAGWVRGEA